MFPKRVWNAEKLRYRIKLGHISYGRNQRIGRFPDKQHIVGRVAKSGYRRSQSFNGKASIYGGVRLYSNKQSKVDLTISGLDPEKTYTFATTANRGVEDNANRKTGFTLSDVESAVNRSSSGTEIDGLYTKFSTGYNTVNGYVARWENISPVRMAILWLPLLTRAMALKPPPMVQRYSIWRRKSVMLKPTR